jgi:hypothetical protein
MKRFSTQADGVLQTAKACDGGGGGSRGTHNKGPTKVPFGRAATVAKTASLAK